MKIMTYVKAAFFGLQLLFFAFAAGAGTTTFHGVSVDYGNASASWVGDELVLTYGNLGEDSLKLGGAVKADVLLVGGGGSGSSGGSSNNKEGYGGGGGEVVARSGVTLSGESSISVGSGGAAVKATSKFSRTSGKLGGKTTIGGALSLEAAEGKAGGGSDVSGEGTASDISGASVTYGADGGSRTSSDAAKSGDDNTGNGGSGGYAGAESGAGGSGVVIVRLKAAYAAVTLADMTLGNGEETSKFAEKTAGAPVDIFFSEVSAVSFSPECVAQATRTKEGRLMLVGTWPGETTVRIVKDKDAVIYTAKVTVTAPIELQDLTVQRGETPSSLVVRETGAALDLDYDAAKALKSSVPEIADFVKLPNGKIGVVGKLTGTADLTIVTEGQGYECKVMVEKLLSGLYKAGAYEVAVSNASDVAYVDGDLVLIYRNVDSAVKKSFVLPKPTTGRLLAVGGGGAGGQEPGVRNDSYGLPGGGGAGGLIVNDGQSFSAATYTVTVGAGGAAPRTKPSKAEAGASGAASTVRVGDMMLTAKGGGGGGARSVGKPGGSGGGGSYDDRSKNGGAASQSDGFANAGGQGGHKKFGAGGGGAGGPGGNTKSDSVNGSGAGGIGKACDITGENLEYARGGAGGVPRLYTHYWLDKSGVVKYGSESDAKKSGCKYFWVEASDGKPGRDGYGDGGGGGSYYSTAYGPTFAGRGGSGAVIVRIPPYKTTVEDALKAAFAGRPVTVSGSTVTLTGDVAGPVEIPDNLGEITVDLNGYAIAGVDGAAGDDITRGGNGEVALTIVKPTLSCEAGTTKVHLTGIGTVKGGNGGDGHPQGVGAAALTGGEAFYERGASVTRTDGADGVFIDQHPHAWEYECFDNRIYANCVADDEETCSYKEPERRPMLAFEATDAEFTGEPYAGLTLVNTITAATGLPVVPPTYVGIEGTDYLASRTPPIEQGKYRVSLTFRNMEISDTFTIVETKQEQDSVYKSWKTAVRNGDEVKIMLSATFSGNRAINDGNVLFLGSRCNAHSMATGTVEKTINAMTKYADVRWYAYGEQDPGNDHVGMLTRKGEKLAYTEKSGKVTGETVHLAGNNHFVHKEMMNDLYAELVEKKNLKEDYDLILLEFDGDLLCREGNAPYQLVYTLPEGWDDEKAAVLRAAMERYYQAGRVVWLVPDVNQPKSDAGYTGEYPWTSNPEFIWQRAFLGATETAGYRNPYQKNYEDADELVKYIEDVLIGGFFQETTITDTVKDGLDIVRVVPQVRDDSGFWVEMTSNDGMNFSMVESHYGVEITAKVTVTGRKVVAVFDTRNVQIEAIKRGELWGNDLRMNIETTMNGFFDGVAPGEWKDTNEGEAVFVFEGSQSGETFTITTTNPPPKLQNILYEPSYKAEDWVSIYDGEGHTITVTVTSPDPTEHPFDIRYSLTEDGTYAKYLLVTNRSDQVPVWFEISDPAGKYLTVTNKAYVTIMPRVVVEQAEDAEKPFDGTPLTQPAHSNVLSKAVEEAAKLYPGQGEKAAGFVKDEGFANVPMTADSQQTEVGSHSNTIDKSAVTVKDNTDPNNYIFIYLPGTLTVTPSLPMGIKASPAEKFYDGVPTNISWVVTNATGVAITPDKVYLREKGTDAWIEAKDFAPYLNATNVAVEVKAEKAGYTPVIAESTVLVKPRIVVSHAKDGEWQFDGEAHAQPEYFEDGAAEAEKSKTKWGTDEVLPDSTGFVDGEGYAADLAMTAASTITDPGSRPNVIDTAAEKTKLAENTKAENYELYYLDGTLKVTPKDFTAKAEPVEKFYDSVPTNIVVTVKGIPDGVTPTYEYSYSETEGFVPADEFTGPTNVSETAEVYCRVIIPGATNTVHAKATIRPRIVVSHAKDGEWQFDGEAHAQPEYFEDEEVEAEKSKAKWGTDEVLPDSTGFVDGEGYADTLAMTAASTITDPGSRPNVIDTAAEKVALKPNTKAENYELYYLDGELKVTPKDFTAKAEPVEKFYDSEPTNIVVTVAGIPDGVTPTYEYSYSETEGYVPADEFTGPTNVSETAEVYCRVIIPGATNTVHATATIRPRIVVSHAKDGEWQFDGQAHAQPEYFEDGAAEAEKSKAKWDTDEVLPDSTGFVDGEGYADTLAMTAASTITDPGSRPNVIDTAAEKVALKPNTKAENYELYYLDGELKVTPKDFTAKAEPVEKFYDGVPTNIVVTVKGIPDGVTPTYEYSYSETEGFVPADEFTGPTNVSETAEVYCRVIIPGVTNTVHATATIRPRIVVSHAKDGEWQFDGEAHAQPEYFEDEEVEAEKSKAKWGTDEVLPDSTGFVDGEGYAADLAMTAASTITDPGSRPNVIDTAAEKTKLAENTKAENYELYYLPGTLTVVQRQQEVRGDVPVTEESQERIDEVLEELVKADPRATDEPFIKYQLTVNPTNALDETTKTSPLEATDAAIRQVELVEAMTGEKVDKTEFIDIVLERTYSKTEAEETERGNYNKNNWDSLDKAEEHGNKLFVVTVPFELPEGMTLIGVTRSCANKGDEILREKDPDDPNAEGFVYNPDEKTISLYARDFCVFGFMMKEVEDEPECEGICSWVDLEDTDPAGARIVYDFKSSVKTTVGKKGKPSKVKVRLGINDDRTALWFDDPCLEGGEYDGVPGVVVFDSKGRRKLDVSKLTNEQRTRLADDLRDYSDLGTGRKDGGSWCAEFTYMTEAGCYRAAGSKKLTATYELEDCCGDGRGGRFVDVTGTLPDIETVMLHRFGGITLEKSNKIEIVAKIGNGPEPIYLRLAGQGELATLTDSRGRRRFGIKSMSGTVVGVIDGPKCESCCDLDADTVAFDCNGELIEQPVGSAAFGSFTLKFNPKKSDFHLVR